MIRPHCKHQRGAALLTAMVIVVLVTTLAAAMVWQQWRAIQVEAAERARTQAYWILSGALDWARLILQEDARAGNNMDHLGEPWATPLAEARLSTFLGANYTHTEELLETFLSGGITDIQGRYNLYNLIDPASSEVRLRAKELKAFQRLCSFIGVSPAIALQIAQNMQQSIVASNVTEDANAGLSTPANLAINKSRPIVPWSIEQLAWFGIDPAVLKRLRPYVTILPQLTTINVNTAPKEVLAAMIEGLDLGGAERLAQRRQRSPFSSLGEVADALGGGPIDSQKIGVRSSFFEIQARLRFEDRVIEQRYLIERRGQDTLILHQERLADLE